MDIYRPQPEIAAVGRRVDLRAVMQEVYLWMTVGLALSAVVAVFFAATNLTAALGPLWFIAILVELGLVFYLSARIFKMSAQRATTLFLVYSALNGVTLSVVFYRFVLSDIYISLFATGAMFAAMSIIGYTTKVDLSRFRGFLLMALIGLLVASIVNIFLASSALYWLVNYAGVLIFAGLTAYDTQWIKNMSSQMSVFGVSSSAEGVVRRVAIIGALKLYLDFINLFLFILRIVGGGRRS